MIRNEWRNANNPFIPGRKVIGRVSRRGREISSQADTLSMAKVNEALPQLADGTAPYRIVVLQACAPGCSIAH